MIRYLGITQSLSLGPRLAHLMPCILIALSTTGCGNTLWSTAPFREEVRTSMLNTGSVSKRIRRRGDVSPKLAVPRHPSVDKFVGHFTSKRRLFMAQALERRARYLEEIEDILVQHGLPPELSNVALVESGFKPTARSRKGAVGMWQFMKTTARINGLRVRRGIDERKDFRKATHAAAKYFNYLYKVLGSWELAIAAYNGGITKVRRAIRRTGTNDFFELAQTNLLRVETKQFVPKVFAATKISRNPEYYGFRRKASGLAFKASDKLSSNISEVGG